MDRKFMIMLRTATQARTSNSSYGQGLVEFALILPVLLLLVLGALDLGRAFYIKVVMENAAREGAYYLVYNPGDKANAVIAAVTEAQNSGITIVGGDVAIACTDGNLCKSGSSATVTVTHTLNLVLDGLFGGPLVMTNDARMLIP